MAIDTYITESYIEYFSGKTIPVSFPYWAYVNLCEYLRVAFWSYLEQVAWVKK